MPRASLLPLVASALLCALHATNAAQETDITQTPNAANAGIQKSLAEQIGAGRGDALTPGSSVYLIQRDPFRAIVRGRQVFQRKFTQAQGAGPRTGDGSGDIESDASIGAGLADSCASCHGRPQGAAGFGGDVFTRPDGRDAPHLFGIGLVEMLADEMSADLRRIRASALTEASTRGATVVAPLRTRGIDFGVLRAFPDGTLDTAGVDGVDPDLRVRPFFAEGSAFSIRAFLVGAFDAEMGLEAVDPDLLAASQGGRATTPAGLLLDGTQDRIGPPPAAHATLDPDLDGVRDEVPTSLVDYTEFYLLNYFAPAVSTREPEEAKRGLETFRDIGCATCHVPNLELRHDRRVADVETRFDTRNGNPFNQLYATAAARFDVVDDGTGLPPLCRPSGAPFQVRGLFSDLKRHDLGPNFHEEQFDGSIVREFVTEPLWGVASSGPYGHDGRSPSLEAVILRHGGEAQAARDAYSGLPDAHRKRVLALLQSLVLFSPPSTASNLRPADPTASGYPLRGHGAIDLSVLFLDPFDKE